MTVKVVIIDTNVLVAGLITNQPDSPTAQILDSMLNGSLIYLLSPELLSEYRTVLLRPKLRALHKLTEQEIDEMLTEITANAIWHESTPNHHNSPDPGDQHLWNMLAGTPHAVLVTGDQLLLRYPHPDRSLVSPATLVQLINMDGA